MELYSLDSSDDEIKIVHERISKTTSPDQIQKILRKLDRKLDRKFDISFPEKVRSIQFMTSGSPLSLADLDVEQVKIRQVTAIKTTKIRGGTSQTGRFRC